MTSRTWTSPSPNETFAFGRRVGQALKGGELLALTGDLGAGKTVFCKGVGSGLGIAPEEVRSPTFGIHLQHQGAALIFDHIDAYRLEGGQSLVDIGFFDFLDERHVVAVEWAGRVADALPEPCWGVAFTHLGGDGRRLEFSGPWPDSLFPSE